MKEILCTPALIAAAGLELQDNADSPESWAADAFSFQRRQMLCFLHLPTQYFLLSGPHAKAELADIRRHFKSALWAAVHFDGFEPYLIDNIVEMFEGMELGKGALPAEQTKLLEVLQKAFLTYSKEAGDNLDIDAFSIHVRNARGPGLAAVTPRETFGLWAQCIPTDD